MDLFEKEGEKKIEPLAARMAPKTLDDFVGQEHIIGEDKLLRKMLSADKLSSVIFYGPPGCGKSALAKIIASVTVSHFVEINAVISGVDDLRKIVSAALNRSKKTILLVDEIHHFNKTQQDCLLPYVEKGVITLIGITTQNPNFYVNAALLSRSMLFEFKKLSDENIRKIIPKVSSELKINFSEDAVAHILRQSDGDARRFLNIVEVGCVVAEKAAGGLVDFNLETAKRALQNKMVLYDKKGDGHYDTISAFIKSMRTGNTDDAVYWLAKMLAAGEDPRFIARRLVIFASEDIGNANPTAVVIAVSVLKAVEFLGMPECRISLSQAAIYLSKSVKSREAYDRIEKCLETVEKDYSREVPEYLKNKMKS